MPESLFNKVAGLRPANFIKKETLAQVLSCEFCETFKNTFLQNTSRRLLLDRIDWIVYVTVLMSITEAHSEPCERSEMKLFAKIGNS